MSKANFPCIGVVHRKRLKFSNRISLGERSFGVGDRYLQVTISLSPTLFYPTITYGDFSFVLSWDKIALLAEQAGLFDKALEVSNE